MEQPEKQSARAAAGSGKLGDLEARAVEHLDLAFQAAQWEVSRLPAQRPAPALFCRLGKLAYAVEVKAAAGRARRPVLQALLADAILQVRVMAKGLGARPLAVVVAPSLSDEMVASLGRYANEFAAEVAWGVVDERGRFELFGKGLQAIRPPENSPMLVELGQRGSARHEAPINLFSDLGQWMLKVLLAPNFYERNRRWLGYRRAPSSPLRGVVDLARNANVSQSSASKFLRALHDQGFLSKSRCGPLEVVRVQSLFEAWRSASRGPWKEQPMRFALPAKDPFRRLRSVLADRPSFESKHSAPDPDRARLGPPGERACLALFSAAAVIDQCFVVGAPAHLYAESLSGSFLADLGMLPVDLAGEADVMVRQPRFPESVFRGASCVPDQDSESPASPLIPAADLIQCWLDISHHPARGPEQASEIAGRLRFSEWSK